MPTEQPHPGPLIRDYMKANGITQVQLAAAVGRSQPTIVRILSAQIAPPLSTLLLILGALGLSLRWLHDHGVRPPEVERAGG